MNRIAMVAGSPAVWMISFGLLGFAAGALVPACQSSTVNCTTGTSRCGAGCADFRSDSLNCGACGVACQSLQICQDSTCQCRPGSVLCGGSCVVTTSDQNCGACGRSCQLPDGGPAVCTPNPDGGLPQCLAQCTPDLTNCAGGCVNLQSDLLNCGQCGRACVAGQGCRAGSCTSDVIAACINTASIVGIQAIADVAGPSFPFGNAPQALASLRGVLLEGDGVDLKLEQMRLQDFGVLTNVNDAGISPNHILVDDPYIYLVNGDAFADAGGAPNSTLQVLQQTGGDAGLGDAGLPFSTIATLSFDQGNPPQAVTKLGNNLYIALFLGAVAEVDVSNPAAPRITRTFDLRTLNLMGFDASVPTFPRPLGIATLGGAVYVALRNLDATGTPGGPGLLARLNLVTGTPQTVLLPDTCLTAYWLGTAADAGNTLYVSCNGRTQRDAGYLTSVDSTGAVAIGTDGGMAMWSGGCDAGVACFPAIPRRFAMVANRLYLGDELGRVFVIENVDGGFVERRGYYSAPGGLPISACTSSVSGSAIVNDIIAVP
jgi:hypothetical protein